MQKTLVFVALTCLSLFLIQCKNNEFTYVLIETEYGKMKAKLYNSTPIHRDNFIKLANQGYYDNLLFHRVIPGFMIQGGDPDSKNAQPGQPLGQGGPGYTLDPEIGEFHVRGALAAARLSDEVNPEKKSSGSQFYIVQGRQLNDMVLEALGNQQGIIYSPEQQKRYLERGGWPPLDNDYTVFGEVVDGLEVIDEIAKQETGPADRPVKDIKMKITVLK